MDLKIFKIYRKNEQEEENEKSKASSSAKGINNRSDTSRRSLLTDTGRVFSLK